MGRDVGAPAVDVQCPLWSAVVDLKMALVKLAGEVTHRCALAARQPQGSATRATSLRFGGTSYQVTVLSGTVASRMTAAELGTDLIVLLADGLTEDRLTALLKRWSKAGRVGSAG